MRSSWSVSSRCSFLRMAALRSSARSSARTLDNGYPSRSPMMPKTVADVAKKGFLQLLGESAQFLGLFAEIYLSREFLRFFVSSSNSFEVSRTTRAFSIMRRARDSACSVRSGRSPWTLVRVKYGLGLLGCGCTTFLWDAYRVILRRTCPATASSRTFAFRHIVFAHDKHVPLGAAVGQRAVVFDGREFFRAADWTGNRLWLHGHIGCSLKAGGRPGGLFPFNMNVSDCVAVGVSARPFSGRVRCRQVRGGIPSAAFWYLHHLAE